MKYQAYRIGIVIGMLAVGGCSRTDNATRVVNRSAGPVTINYVDAIDGHARSLNLEPGTAGRLWRNESISTLTALEFATSERTYDMWNWDTERKRLTCRGNCVITWEADRRIRFDSGRT